MAEPLISICIPAYKRVGFLERLLDSIVAQDMLPFEVIVTDDSPDDSVRMLAARYLDKLPLHYYKNPVALGTPENWNEAMRKATGTWIKIMHDDDWFEGRDSLSRFAKAIGEKPGVDFIFSAYQNVQEESGKVSPVKLSATGRRMLQRNAWHLLGTNYIGNPSCTLFKKDNRVSFDPGFKWVVDFEFYIRYLEAHPGFAYIDSILVDVGINASQVTNYTFGIAEVQVPENHTLLQKNGTYHLRNLVVYDYFWRLYRNLGVQSEEAIKAAGYNGQLHKVQRSMIRWQSKIPEGWLKSGVVSKTIMFLHYLTHVHLV